MRKMLFVMISFFAAHIVAEAQENLSYQKPSPEIMALFDYQRAPGVVMDEKKQFIVFTYTNTYRTLDELILQILLITLRT